MGANLVGCTYFSDNDCNEGEVCEAGIDVDDFNECDRRDASTNVRSYDTADTTTSCLDQATPAAPKAEASFIGVEVASAPKEKCAPAKAPASEQQPVDVETKDKKFSTNSHAS